MARAKGTANFSGTIEPLAGGALDARDIVQAKADLTASGTFPYPYVGMETYVVAENKKYRLIGSDPTVLANWEEVGSGGGDATGRAYSSAITTVFDPASTYQHNELVMYGDELYRCTAVSHTGAWDASHFLKMTAASAILSRVPDYVSGRFYSSSVAQQFASNISYQPGDIVVYEDLLYKFVNNHLGDWDDNDVVLAILTDNMGGSYTAGDGIDITNDKISVDAMPAADMSEIITPLPSVMSRRFKYSTEEQVVGEWIDGKPLYQKVVSGTTSSSGDTIIQLDEGNNILQFNVGVRYAGSEGSYAWYWNSTYFNSNDYTVAWTTIVSAGSSIIPCIKLRGSNNFLSKPYVAIVQYTKTTDTPV